MASEGGARGGVGARQRRVVVQNFGVGSFSVLLSTIVLFNAERCFPGCSDGFLKRLGSLEGMELEGSPRKTKASVCVCRVAEVLVSYRHGPVSQRRLAV